MALRILPIFVLMVFLPGAVVCQQPKPSPSSGAQSKDEVVRVTTNLVQVDLVATDKDGKQVSDLRPEDFEVFEDGRKQQITNFSYISTNAASASQPANTPAAQTTDKNGSKIPPARLSPEQARRTIVLVVDDLGLSFESMGFVRQALKRFVDEQMQPNDRVAIVCTSAGTGALQQFTSEKRQLNAAIERVQWYPAGRGGLSPYAPLDTQQNSDFTNAQQIINEMEENREANYAVGTLGTLGFVVRGLSELPGRKAVMLISESFRLFTAQGRNIRLLEALRRLTDQANLASTVIYTLDASGLNPLNFTAEDKVSGAYFDPSILQDPNGPVQTPARNRSLTQRNDVPPSLSAQAETDSASAFRKLDALMTQRDNQNIQTQSVLSYLAQRTGGLFIGNTNNLSLGTQRMIEDQKGYYLLGYRPDESVIDPATGHRRFHNLTVKVKRSGLNVRARSGYYGITTEELRSAKRTREGQLAAALNSPFAAGGVGLRMTTVFGSDPGTGSYIRVLLHVNAHDLIFTEQPDGSRKTVLDFVAVNYGDGGHILDQFVDTQTIGADANAYPGLLQNGLRFVLNVPVKQPGACQLRAAVRDASSERIGSASQFIEVPDLSKNRLTLSGILINGTNQIVTNKTSAGGTSTLPSTPQATGDAEKKADGADPQAGPAVRRLRHSMILNYLYTIYNAQVDGTGHPQLQTQMRLFREGKEVFTGKVLPYNVGQQGDMKHLSAGGRLLIGTNLVPGEYILQVTVTDALAKEKQNTSTQWMDFQIIE